MTNELNRRSFLEALGAVVSVPVLWGIPSAAFGDTPSHTIADVDGRFIRIVDSATKMQSIYAFNLDLSDELVPKDNNLSVFAYSVFISGTLKSSGRSIQIVCNELRVADQAMIDLRGPDPNPDFAGRSAQNGQAPGQKGADGGDGGDGPNAGNLLVVATSIAGTIRVNASGRNGGAAQSGGNGSDGQAGADNPGLGSTGAVGQAGGPPGKPGTPGHGGSGGTVSILTVTPLRSGQFNGQIIADVREGAPGVAGHNGHPGKGGPGGMGASGRTCEWEQL